MEMQEGRVPERVPGQEQKDGQIPSMEYGGEDPN